MAPSLLHKKEHSSPRNVGPVISKICRFAKTRPDSRFCPNLFWQRGVCGGDHQREAPQGITAQCQARQSNYKVLERRETSRLQPPAKDIPGFLAPVGRFEILHQQGMAHRGKMVELLC
jgi:hypothetical protein